jgi:hypothetical protein
MTPISLSWAPIDLIGKTKYILDTHTMIYMHWWKHKPRNEHKTNNSQWWGCQLKTPRCKTQHEEILFQEALQMQPIFSLFGIPNEIYRKYKHKTHSKVPKAWVFFFFTPQKSKSHQTTSHLHKHVLPNTNALKIPNELHHSLDNRPLIMVLNCVSKRYMS